MSGKESSTPPTVTMLINSDGKPPKDFRLLLVVLEMLHRLQFIPGTLPQTPTHG